MELSSLINTCVRLCRFENPIKRNLAIAKKVLFKHTLDPKVSYKNFFSYLPSTLDSMIGIIWNNSLENNSNVSEFPILNAYLAFEELKIFSAKSCLNDLLFSGRYIKINQPLLKDSIVDLDINTLNFDQISYILFDNGYNTEFVNNKYLEKLNIYEKLYISYRLSYPLNYNTFLKQIKLSYKDNYKDIPIEIKRLIELDNIINNFDKTINQADLFNKVYSVNHSLRKKVNLNAPQTILLLVEGITEELVLPKIAKVLSYDFNADGLYLLSAGGKNQVARLYNEYKDQVNIPIAILLDSDAIEIIDWLKATINSKDKFFIIPNGEFEDILPKELICKSLNKEFMLSPGIKISDIDENKSTTKQLINIWKQWGLGDFSKSQFASIIATNLDDPKYVSKEIKNIIEGIYSLL